MLRNLQPASGNDIAGWSGRCWGTYQADKEIISIDQIVAAGGPREPQAALSRKDFIVAFVYLLELGQMPDPDLLRLHREYRDKVIEYWFHIAGGRSRITTNVGPRISEGDLGPTGWQGSALH